MSQMPMREKLKKIAEAAKDGGRINERPKKIGLLIFFIFTAIGIIAIFAFAIVLLIHGYKISALISSLFATFLLYIAYKLITADDISL